MIVKPTDSAGSKGVTRIDSLEEYEDAVDYAFEKSMSGTIIVEEFIDKVGCSSDTDSFLLNGELKFISFNAQRFDESAANPYTPAAYSWPSTFVEHEEYLRSELQRLLLLLNMKTSVFNIETRVASNGKPYIMECTPRGGGNRLCEMLRYATGVDLITAQVRAAVGDSVEDVEQQPYNGHWAEIILHADKDGIFSNLEIASDLPAKVVERDLWVKKGDNVTAFHGANDAIGTLVLHFDNKEDMEYAINHQSEWLKVIVE
jgi:biotin carboxylase